MDWNGTKIVVIIIFSAVNFGSWIENLSAGLFMCFLLLFIVFIFDKDK